MVHPYLKRRVVARKRWTILRLPAARSEGTLQAAAQDLWRVPLFQEQAMRSPLLPLNSRRPKPMAAPRHGDLPQRGQGRRNIRQKMIGGMLRRGYPEAFAERCFHQIEGFGSYGFPESHAMSFAKLVYVSPG
jgi:error-prone DNA polymerase